MLKSLRNFFSFMLKLIGVLLALVIIALSFFRAQAAFRERNTRHEAAPASGRFVQTAGGELFIQEAGPPTGKVVILIHGSGGWSELWRPTINALAAASYHVIAVDSPPFGFSERPKDLSYSNLDQAKRIIGVIDALKIQRAMLVGHSFGGGATLTTLTLAPERFDAVVFVNVAIALATPANNQTQPNWALDAFFAARPLHDTMLAATLTNPMLTDRWLGTFVYQQKGVTPETVTLLQRPLSLQNTTADLGDWLAYFMAHSSVGAEENLRMLQAIKAPTLIIWGDQDTVTLLAQGQRLHGLIPTSQLVVIKDVGHVPQIEDVAVFNQTLLAFLNSQ